MNQSEAILVAQSALEEQEAVGRYPLSLFGPAVETERAWIFSYQSTRWVETGGREDELLGTGPLYVHKRSKTAHFLGTYARREQVIADFERQLDEQAAPTDLEAHPIDR